MPIGNVQDVPLETCQDFIDGSHKNLKAVPESTIMNPDAGSYSGTTRKFLGNVQVFHLGKARGFINDAIIFNCESL